ncbi:MAG: UDP-3-O-(3-hydroxymyristoyl)glucosamine N-acyltransferase [Pseudomonadota bacterium]
MNASALAVLVGGRLVGPDRAFGGVASLERAGADDCAFTVKVPATTAAGVLLATAPVEGACTVVVPDPRAAFGRLLRALFPERHPEGVQSGAHVDPSAHLGPGVSVYPGAYVGPDVQLGAGTVVLPNAVILAGTVVGAGCVIGPGAVLGHAGFGLEATPEGLRALPQVGRVVLGEGVGVGANTCVDRAFVEETRVGDHSQIDNLVQVGHNCHIGRGAVLVAQVGLSGSVSIGDGAVLAGQAGVADHVAIGAGAMLGGQTGAHRDVPDGERWMGTPALPLHEAAKVFAAARQVPELLKRVRALEKELAKLKGG